MTLRGPDPRGKKISKLLGWEIMGSDCGPQDIEKQTEELGKILNEILEQLKSIRRYGINQTKS